jgi:hypothetical protein
MKAIIISQPKSGTYLCANLLKEIGMHFTGLHLSEDYYQKYDLDNLDDSRKNPKKYTKKMSVNKSINLIEDKSFAVSHLCYSKKNTIITKEYKKIILTRDYNEVLSSWNRWALSTNRSQKSIHIEKETQKNILSWLNEHNVFHITFEELISKNIEKINSLQLFLFNKINADSNVALDNALTSPSLTKSSIR